jgi:type II secretory pathway pseudopilin PulG
MAKNVLGVTMLEMIMVVVIVAVVGGLGIPVLRKSIENKEAKSALGTLRTISHAVRMYAAEHTQEVSSFSLLEGRGYLKRQDFTPGYSFEFDLTSSPNPPYAIAACKPDCVAANRKIIIGRDPNDTSKDIVIQDYPVGLFCESSSTSTGTCT